VRDLEDATLALDLAGVLLARDVRDVFAGETSATSSPNITIFGSRRISSRMQALSRSTIVVSFPENWGSSSVSNCSLVGSTSGE
jgi:hypothetical protein